MPIARALRSLPAVTAADVLVFAVWIGAWGGLTEAARSIWRQRFLHFPTGLFTEPGVLWMGPVAAITFLGALGLLIIALDRLVRGHGLLLRVAPAVFAALASYSLLRGVRIGMANIAAAVLAIGVATVLVRIIAAQPVLVRRVVRWNAAIMVAALLAWAIAVPAWRGAESARLIAGLPAPRPGSPNVLIIIWDTARAMSLSLYGYDRQTTPELDRFAAGGAVFERAFATSPWSLPSHSSMFTGRYPTELSAARQAPLDDTFPTLAEVLADNGYATGGFSANIYYGASAFGIARGFARYEAHPPINAAVIASTWWLSGRTYWELIGRRNSRAPGPMRPRASDVNRSLLRWIDRRGERPFFAVINHFDAHDPYFPPEPFATAFTPTRPRYWLDEAHTSYDDDTLRQLRDAYDSALLYLDHELGRLLAALQERGELDNTVIILTSDHGEEFGEHAPDIVKHARTLYAHALHVPLVVVHPPTVPAAVRVRETVSIRDIPATVMDVLGLADASPFPGTSLRRYATGSVTPAEAAEPRLAVAEHSPMGGVLPSWPIAAGDMFAVIDSDLHYILDGAGREQLFDLTTDPLQQHDLAAEPGYETELARMRRLLDEMVPPREDGTRRAFLERGGRTRTDTDGHSSP
jgi:arylsulfatase A-like enzyme